MESLALLQRYMREPPSPSRLFENPYYEISGDRVLGDWFAGQLLDSALFRSIAACDRLVILLWIRAGEPSRRRRDGRSLHPAFTRHFLRYLRKYYEDQRAWPLLYETVEGSLFGLAKELRDGFTHSRRLASELHGEPVVAYSGQGPARGLEADEHRALVLAFYNEILGPSIEHVGTLLARQPTA
jgi:hypothetical protein